MSAEIICIGTEMLLGEILNSNAQYLAQQLAVLGIPHYYQTVVGDNVPRIHQVLELACGRSQLLIFTGGLGPTPDDLTTEAIAQFFNTPLVEKPEVLEDIRQKFARREREMSPSNRKQALIPEGATLLPNPTGSAPGMIWQPRPNLTILTFPGVPKEMHVMWEQTAVPYLRSQGWGAETIYSRTLRFWGIPESTLAEKVDAFLALENPTVAPYAGNGEARLRISAKAATEAAALAAIDPIDQKIRDLIGHDCYGADEDTIASVTGNLLKAAQQTVSVAESCTGGGLGYLLTATAGSSAYFWGGVISYDNQVKVNLLGVAPELLEQQGAVSAEVACEMAVGVRDRLHTTWGLSITGIAGPEGGTKAKPVGLVYIGVASATGVESFRYLFGTFRDREFVRYLSACTAIDLLRRKLLAR
ncbi:MAG: competence/damage-inducible protein A [Cyanobacteria bacterium CAN_BIN43]|nr:competence/damage-inducible protein A [Cyanobacteria bacterium CAN_BIN43]